MGDRWWHKLTYGLVNVLHCLHVLLVEQPDVVFAVGSAQAIPAGLAAKLLGIPIWYAESLTRVERPSRTGRWMYVGCLATQFFYHWPRLAVYYPQATYIPVFA